MRPIEAYASTYSVLPGDNISFHVRSEFPHFYFYVAVFRKGLSEQQLHSGFAGALSYSTPPDAYCAGCGWPAAHSVSIPDSWSSGVYIARFTSIVGGARADAVAEVLFVVRSAAPGTKSRILLQLAVTTYEAYSNWGGKSLYDYNSTDGVEANIVSFNRPMNDEYAIFYSYEYPMVVWLEKNGIEVEYCTSVDLHVDASLADHYRLIVSVGHDEYWSREMRDQVEAFVGNGGNVAFFSGNVCWWQVRLEDNNRSLVCYRSAVEDPERDPGLKTVRWHDAPVNRPENQMTGVSFRNGAGFWNDVPGGRPLRGYVVSFPQHWVFDMTGLAAGQEFGRDHSIIGYETDAALFEVATGVPVATGFDGTPRNFIILGTADCTDWAQGGQAGFATMGMFRNNGTVFTAATTDWSHGLMGDWNEVCQITENVLRRLSGSCPPAPEVLNGGFEKWTDSTVPDSWHREGKGHVQTDINERFNGHSSVRVDASAGQTWISQGDFWFEGLNYYRVGCWARADWPGATIRLQGTTNWNDFAIAEHSGGGGWEYLCAVGRITEEGPMFSGRIKIEVAEGVVAHFDGAHIEAL